MGRDSGAFEFYVGGGLGAVPHQAKLFDEFLPEEELLPMAQAIVRVFARLGEKRNRARARVKFLIAKLGIEEFRKIVLEERKKLTSDHKRTEYLSKGNEPTEVALKRGIILNGTEVSEEFKSWRATNVYSQRQSGLCCSGGDLTLG